MLSPDRAAQHSARFVSTLLHPFLLAPLTILVLTQDWRTAALIAALAVLPMLVVTAIKVRRRSWSDFDVSRASQRSGFYRIGLPIVLATGLVLARTGASPAIVRGTFTVAALLLCALLLGRFLKTSLHMLFAAYCAVLIMEAHPMATPILIVLLVALGWSRKFLKRHTLAEIVAGTALGVIGGLALVLP